jgi:Zn-dependent protease
MSDNFSWSTNVGRWMGIPVRVHLLLFLLIAAIFGVQWNINGSNADFLYGTAMVTAVVLIASILLHEFAHVFALNNLGGNVNSLVLMPWGGNSDYGMPPNARGQVIVYLAGPFVNCVVFLFGTALLIQSDHSTLANLINPVGPHAFEPTKWQVSLTEIVTWINFQLMLVNLIPCYPFDGASAVRSLIAAMNVDLPKLRVESAIKLIGTAVAIAFIGTAWFVRDIQVGPVHPMWLLFLLMGITLLFSSNYSLHIETREDDSDWEDVEDMDYDSIYSESSFFDFSNETENTAYSQWLQEKQEARREIEMRKEKEEDRRADEILKKLHRSGISCLTEDERLILDRVSARIRRRRQTGVSSNDQ